MDTRADFQRLLEDMDKVIETKRQELSELDERLESARGQLSEKEAQELRLEADRSNLVGQNGSPELARQQQQRDEYIQEQSKLYEQQLAKFSEELSELESINLALIKENESLKFDLGSTKTILENLKAKSYIMAESLKEVEDANLELNLRLARAESESQMQQKLLKKSHNEDQVLMEAFNDKLESMKMSIELRDEEIKQLRSDNQFTLECFGINWNDYDNDKIVDPIDQQQQQQPASRQSVTGNNPKIRLTDGETLIDSGRKQRVIEIARAFREKDSQIELLKSQLLEASKELENNANVIENLTKVQTKKRISSSDCDQQQQYQADHDVEGQEWLQPTMKRWKMLENELEAKDRQLHLAEFRLHHYETILPNTISDLVERFAISFRSSKGKFNQQEANNGDESKLINREIMIENLMGSLKRLLSELNSSRCLLDNIDYLRNVIELKDAQIEQLVGDLNQIDAKFSLVQQQQLYDLTQSSAQNQQIVSMKENNKLQETIESGLIVKDELKLLSRASNKIDSSQQNVNLCRAAESQELENYNDKDKTGTANSEANWNRYSNKMNDDLILTPVVRSKTHQTKVQAQAQEHNISTIDGSKSSNFNYDYNYNSHQLSVNGVGIGSKRSISGKVDGLSNDGITLKQSKAMRAGSEGVTEQSVVGKTIDLTAPLNLQTRLRQLENENELLEMAMKEILLSIKWSDAQCGTILIDCPSLERLCQLIEARFLTSRTGVKITPTNSTARASVGNRQTDALAMTPRAIQSSNSNDGSKNGDLFQFIVLKSELDLLRGQNEQLRADAKIQRREYQKLMNIETTRSTPKMTANPNPTNTLHVETNGLTSNESLELVKSQPDVAQVTSTEQPADGNGMERRMECLGETVGSQTEPVVVSWLVANCDETGGVGDGKCENCRRLANLTNHLLQCIVRLETRVNVSDETYIGRLVSLNGLIRAQHKDLAFRESLLSQAKRECQSLREEKLIAEGKLQFMEAQMSTYRWANAACPMGLQLQGCGGQATCNSSGNLEVYTTTKNGIGESIQSLTTISASGQYEKKNQQQVGPTPMLRNADMTITLLKSIIRCLQARLDYKDERLRQLELLLSDRSYLDTETVSISSAVG